MAILGGPDIVTDGLVLCLDAANSKSYSGSGTVWTDLSGNNNTGTVVNDPIFNSASRGVFSFDGTNDHITIADSASLDVGNFITANVWIYPTISNFGVILGKLTSDFSLGWELTNSNGSLRSTLRPSTTQFNIIAGLLGINTWYMVTMTFDNSTLRLYINGLQTGSTSSGGPVTLNSNESLTIARRNQGNYFNGNIACVQIYNRVLFQSEILQNYNAIKGRFGL
jgi:hypothetical protein